MLDINRVPSQDPIATSALKVWEDMLCCMKLTLWWPFENACSASVEAAVCQTDEYFPYEISWCCAYLAWIKSPTPILTAWDWAPWDSTNTSWLHLVQQSMLMKLLGHWGMSSVAMAITDVFQKTLVIAVATLGMSQCYQQDGQPLGLLVQLVVPRVQIGMQVH